MLIIDARDSDSIDKALKKYKKKFDSTKMVRQLRARQHFTKPSVIRRNQLIKATYIEKLNKQED